MNFDWLPWVKMHKRLNALENAVYGDVKAMRPDYPGGAYIPDAYNRQSLRTVVASLMREAKLEATYRPGIPPSLDIEKKKK